MNRKKRIACLAGVTLFAGIFTGCAMGGRRIPEPITIMVWNCYSGEQQETFNALVESFNETVGKKKGIIVKTASQGSVNDLETNVMEAAEEKVGADDMPNIFSAYADTAYKLDQMGQLVDFREYLSEKEIDEYIDAYMEEGTFSNDGSMKIFPVAKSTELLFLNKTDWEEFAKATETKESELETIEGLIAVAEKYYDWTDDKTEEPDDGKAFFGRDAMANYMLVGAKQLGTTLFEVKDGQMKLNFDKDVIRRLWDNYYVPYVKGYFSSSGRFRSDDIKIGNIIAYVGSTSSATFFPKKVITSEMESHDIEMEILPAPIFEDGEKWAIQQGAGMVVTKGTEEEIKASVEFLKWFTAPKNNTGFSVSSGYLPVTKKATDMIEIHKNEKEIPEYIEAVLTEAVKTVNNNKLYTTPVFEGALDARSFLDYAMSDAAEADRRTIIKRIQAGQSMEEAVQEFVSDDRFDKWYEETMEKLQKYEG